MKIWVACTLLLTGLAWASDLPPSEEVIPILTVGTNVYENARIVKTTATEAFIKFEGGLVRAKLSDLPKVIQEKYPPTQTPDPPTASKPRRPAVIQPVPLDLAIRNLETQIGILERAKEKLQTASTETDGAATASGDNTKATDTQRRVQEIDRNLSRLRADLARYQAIREQAEARRALLTASTNLPPAVTLAGPTNSLVQRRFPPFGANRPIYRNGPLYPRRTW